MKVEACSIGPIAKLVLLQSGTAKTIACFDRSFYLKIDNHIICVADEAMYNGPINLLLRRRDVLPSLSSSGLTVGHEWALHADHLAKIDGSEIRIDLRSSLLWEPIEAAWPLGRCKIIRGIDRLTELLASLPQRGSLLRLILDPSSDPRNAVERAAIGPIRALHHHSVDWLRDGDPGILASFHDLLGLGPGLTPSGDDMIAGMLIACHSLGQGEAALDLWRQLENDARCRTTPISFAHLSAAGMGMGAAPFHQLVDALAKNQEALMIESLDAVAEIGHCSGFDAVGGLLLLLPAWIAANDGQTAAA